LKKKKSEAIKGKVSIEVEKKERSVSEAIKGKVSIEVEKKERSVSEAYQQPQFLF
jgi:hypothetical protein